MLASMTGSTEAAQVLLLANATVDQQRPVCH